MREFFHASFTLPSLFFSLPRGSGRATSLSRVSGNGTLSSSGFISFLDSSILITGAVLASTGQCIIEDVVTFDISTQEIDSNGIIQCACV